MRQKVAGIHRLCLALAACVVVGAFAAGCGGGSDSSSSATTGGGGSEPTGEPVKIGIIGDKIGLANAFAVVESAVNALNDRGGIEGRPVELIECDDKLNPNVTTTCGREMVDEEVVAVVGGGAANGNVLVGLFEDAEIPSIGVSVVTPQEKTSDAYFFFASGSGDSQTILSSYSGQNGLKTTLFVIEVPNGKAIIQPTFDDAEAAGTPLFASVEVPSTTADYAPILASGKLDEADAALLVLAPTQEPAFLRTAISEGYDPVWLLEGEPSQEIEEAFGGTVDNTIFASPFGALTPESEDPEVVRYLDELEKGAEEGVDHADEAAANPSYTEAFGWLGVQVIAQLAEEHKVEEMTGPGLLKALQEVDGLKIPLVGAWYPNEINEEGFRGGNEAYDLTEVVDGKYVELTEEPVTAEELITGEVKVRPPAAGK